MLFPRFRKSSVSLGIIFCGLLLAILLVFLRPETSPQKVSEKVWPVNVVRAEPIDIQPKISIFGEVKAAREAQLRTVLSGRVATLNPQFKNGTFVKKGTELLTIERTDYEHHATEKRAELVHSEAVLRELKLEKGFEQELQTNSEKKVSLARRALERTMKLAASGKESKKATDDAESKLAGTEEEKLLREQKIARLESRIHQQVALHEKATATLALAEQTLSDTLVIAPFDGYAANVKLALGQLLSAGEKIGRLLSVHDLEVRFELPEGDYGRFTSKTFGSDPLIGRSLEIVWKLGSKEYEYKAKLTRVGAELNAETGGVAMYASIESPAGRKGLRSGAFVEILFPDFEYHNVYQIPIRAVAEKAYVYVVRNQRLVRLPVEVVGKANDSFLVRSEMSSGELIVSRLFENIGPGLLVKAL